MAKESSTVGKKVRGVLEDMPGAAVTILLHRGLEKAMEAFAGTVKKEKSAISNEDILKAIAGLSMDKQIQIKALLFELFELEKSSMSEEEKTKKRESASKVLVGLLSDTGSIGSSAMSSEKKDPLSFLSVELRDVYASWYGLLANDDDDRKTYDARRMEVTPEILETFLSRFLPGDVSESSSYAKAIDGLSADDRRRFNIWRKRIMRVDPDVLTTLNDEQDKVTTACLQAALTTVPLVEDFASVMARLNDRAQGRLNNFIDALSAEPAAMTALNGIRDQLTLEAIETIPWINDPASADGKRAAIATLRKLQFSCGGATSTRFDDDDAQLVADAIKTYLNKPAVAHAASRRGVVLDAASAKEVLTGIIKHLGEKPAPPKTQVEQMKDFLTTAKKAGEELIGGMSTGDSVADLIETSFGLIPEATMRAEMLKHRPDLDALLNALPVGQITAEQKVELKKQQDRVLKIYRLSWQHRNTRQERMRTQAAAEAARSGGFWARLKNVLG